MTGKEVTHGIAGTFVFADLLGNDVPGAFQGIIGIFDIAFHEGGNPGVEVVLPLHHYQQGEGLEPFLTGGFRTGLAFRLVGQVDIFKGSGIPGRIDALLQFGCQFALFTDGAENGLFTLGEVGEFIVLRFDSFYLHFVQAARDFFTIAADERDSGSLGQ